MELYIDQQTIIPEPGQSLSVLVDRLGLNSTELKTMPLAAKISGEVFN